MIEYSLKNHIYTILNWILNNWAILNRLNMKNEIVAKQHVVAYITLCSSDLPWICTHPRQNGFPTKFLVKLRCDHAENEIATRERRIAPTS